MVVEKEGGRRKEEEAVEEEEDEGRRRKRRRRGRISEIGGTRRATTNLFTDSTWMAKRARVKKVFLFFL